MSETGFIKNAKRLKENVELFGIAGVGYSIQDTIGEGVLDVLSVVDKTVDKVDGVLNDVFDKIEKSGEKTIAKRELKPGDIIAVSRKLPYQHFGVYIGDGRVIHFAAPNGDWEGTPVIHEAPFENFLRDSKEFEILEFGERRGETKRYVGLRPMGSAFVNSTVQRTGISLISLVELFRDLEYHLYSPEETVQRAKMVAEQRAREGSVIKTFLNGHAYNLVFNNCEHFAIWCKTGVHESGQVDRVLKRLVEL